jgi:hypothetical protein
MTYKEKVQTQSGDAEIIILDDEEYELFLVDFHKLSPMLRDLRFAPLREFHILIGCAILDKKTFGDDEIVIPAWLAATEDFVVVVSRETILSNHPELNDTNIDKFIVDHSIKIINDRYQQAKRVAEIKNLDPQFKQSAILN